MDRDAIVGHPPESAAWATGEESLLRGGEPEGEAHVRQLLDTLRGVISSAPLEGESAHFNHEVQDILRVSLAEILGTNWSSVRQPDDAKRAPKDSAHQGAESPSFRKCVIALNSYISSLVSRRLREGTNRQDARRMGLRSNERLSERECAVLTLIAKGQSNKRVAQTLRIAPETVKSHVKRAFVKLGSKTRAEAVARATELGFLSITATPSTSSIGSEPSLRALRAPTSARRMPSQGNTSCDQNVWSLGGPA
jgi:DNA-binding CsgD family transcriptional regulator